MVFFEKPTLDLRRIALVRAVANVAYGLTNKHVLAFQALWRAQSAFLIVNRDMRHWAPVLQTHTIRDSASIVPLPMVKLSESELTGQLGLSPAALEEFRDDGAIFITERATGTCWTAHDWLRNLRREGAAVLTAENAADLLVGQDPATADRLYYTRTGWQTPEVRMAEALGISAIFDVARDVVDTNRPTLVIVTPGLPAPLRLWRINVLSAFGHEIQLASE